jgi:mannose/fructose/N-acetylgalactosamine-specific phosphotransferase system component IID
MKNRKLIGFLLFLLILIYTLLFMWMGAMIGYDKGVNESGFITQRMTVV